MTSSDRYSHPFNPLKVLSFDLETTSANPFEARIVTSALVRIDDSGSHPTELLANPGIDIPEEAQKIHGITTEYAQKHGRDHAEVLAETIHTIRTAWDHGYTLIVFNSSYDLSVLHHLDPSFLIDGPVYDPFVIDKIFDRYRTGKRHLGALAQHYGVKLDNAHNATADSLAAARIAWKQATHTFKENISHLSLGELMEKQAVGYNEIQSHFKKYLESQNRLEDAQKVNLSWPMQRRR